MKHLAGITVGLSVAMVAALVMSTDPRAQESGGRGDVPTEPPKGGWGSSLTLTMKSAMANPYRLVENWPRLVEKNIKPGAAPGIIPDGKGGVWLHQRSEPPILKIDSSGAVVQGWGDGMFSQAHGFCRDRDGNFWAGDAAPFGDDPKGGAKSFVFHKFAPDGKLLMTIGKPGVSKVGPDTFIQPTACVSMPNGNIMIADGHIPRPSYTQQDGDRLAEITREGKFVRSYGRQGVRPGEFWGPHSLAYDSQGRLFVADRTNNRLQIFDKDMNFVDEWRHFGRPSFVYILKDDTMFVGDSESKYEGFTPAEFFPRNRGASNPGWQNGIRVGNARDGSLKYFIPGTLPEGGAADELGNVYSGWSVSCGEGTPGNRPGNQVNCLQKWVKK